MSETEIEIAEQMSDDSDGLSEDEQAEQESHEQAEQDAPEDQAAPSPRSQKEIDKLHDTLRKEGERHAKRVAEIMGDDFSLLVPSPIDWTPGFLFGVPGMLPGPEQLQALHEILGDATHADLQEASDTEPCPACNALGEVLTGSRKQGQETKPCVACGGTGWKPKLAPVAQPPNVTQFPAQPAQPTDAPNQFPVADRWGRPQGHPHYNMEPAFVGS